MADEATESTSTASPAAPAPAAPRASSNGENPQNSESFVESMRRIAGGDMDDSGPELTDVERAEAQDEPVGPGKPKATPAAKDAAAADDADPDAAKKAWIADGAKHGYAVDEAGKVTTKERAEWRQARSAQKQWLTNEENQARQRIDEYVRTNMPNVERASAILTAADSGDYEALAKTLGHDDWTKLNEHIIARNSDPSYREVLQLKRAQADRDARDRQAAEQYQTQQRESGRQQQVQKDLEAVTNYAGQSADPLLKELRDVPLVVNSVYQMLVDNHDGQSTVTPEQAIDLPMAGGPSIRAQMKGFYERLHRVFGQTASPGLVPSAPTPEPSAKPKKPSGATAAASRGAVEPSEPRKMTDAEWVRHGARQLARSQREDEREGKAS